MAPPAGGAWLGETISATAPGVPVVTTGGT
jgi:hypothetical protein